MLFKLTIKYEKTINNKIFWIVEKFLKHYELLLTQAN